MTKTRKYALISLTVLALAYVLLVVGFELRMGLGQPQFGDATLVITTTREDGSSHARVLARLQHEDGLYVAVNHWPRAWYRQALANPNVQITLAGETGDYVAVPVSDSEHQMLQERFPLGLRSRFMMGFPPRHFLRLDPV